MARQTLKALIQIPQYFDLSSLTDRQSKVNARKHSFMTFFQRALTLTACFVLMLYAQTFREAVDTIIDIAGKAQDKDLLLCCSQSLGLLWSEEYPFKASVVPNIQLFCDNVRSDLCKTVDALQKASPCWRSDVSF